MLVLVSLGCATLANRITAIWAQVHGVYLWTVSVLVFAVFLGTLELSGRKLAKRHSANVRDEAQGRRDLLKSLKPAARPLVERVELLARDILAFLRDLGPKASPHGYDTATWMQVNGPRVEAINKQYFDRFKPILESLLAEVEAEGITDHGISRGLVEPQAQNEDRMRSIAEQLLVARNKLQIKQYEPSSSEVWERAGQGGPYILLNWDYSEDAKKFIGMGIAKKQLVIENSGNVDAHDVHLRDVSLTPKITATFRPIARVTPGSKIAIEPILTGAVPDNHQGDFDMAYFAAGDLPNEFEEFTPSGELKAIRFPMVITFKDYGEDYYRARFQCVVDTLTYRDNEITYLGRDRLKRQPQI
jgi:hypothetical protein